MDFRQMNKLGLSSTVYPLWFYDIFRLFIIFRFVSFFFHFDWPLEKIYKLMYILKQKDFSVLKYTLSASSFLNIEPSVKSRFLLVYFLFLRIVRMIKRSYAKEYLPDSVVLRRFLFSFF